MDAVTAGPSWRAMTDEPFWTQYDTVIVSNAGPRPSYEVFIRGRQVATRDRLDDAKTFVEKEYGPLQWSRKRLDKMEVTHRFFGPTTEFGEAATIHVSDLPRMRGVAVRVPNNSKVAAESYQTGHQPDETGPPINDMTAQVGEWWMPEDFYEHPEMYIGAMDGSDAREAVATVVRCRGRSGTVKVYRAMYADLPPRINPGDWVTITRGYAEIHGRSNLHTKPWVIVEADVPMSTVRFAGDDLAEWGYFGPSTGRVASKTASGTITLYHGTTAENAEAIKASDLHPPSGVNPWTWYMLTTSKEQAARYSMRENSVVLEFRLTPAQVEQYLGRPETHDVYNFPAQAYGVVHPLPGSLVVATHPTVGGKTASSIPPVLYHGTRSFENVDSILSQGIRPTVYLTRDLGQVVEAIGSGDLPIFAIRTAGLDLERSPRGLDDTTYRTTETIPPSAIIGVRWATNDFAEVHDWGKVTYTVHTRRPGQPEQSYGVDHKANPYWYSDIEGAIAGTLKGRIGSKTAERTYEEEIEHFLAEAKAGGKADFGSTEEVRRFLEPIVGRYGVRIQVSHKNPDGTLGLGAKAWVYKDGGQWVINLRPEHATKSAALHEAAHVIDVETNGWPEGGVSRMIDMKQSWAHGPRFQEVLQSLQRFGSLRTRGKATTAAPVYRSLCFDCIAELNIRPQHIATKPAYIDTCTNCDRTLMCKGCSMGEYTKRASVGSSREDEIRENHIDRGKGRLIENKTWMEGKDRWSFERYETYGEIRINDGSPKPAASMMSEADWDAMGGAEVGYLGWYYDDTSGVITIVDVDEERRRQGLATKMLEFARAHSPVPIEHSNTRNGDGRGWSKATGSLRRGRSVVASMGGSQERSFNDHIVMRFTEEDQGERKLRQVIRAYDGGKKVGELNWYGTTGTIHHIEVETEYMRQGLATAMWAWGQDFGRPKPKHSGDRTTQGDAWARSVGGPIPRANGSKTAVRTRGRATR